MDISIDFGFGYLKALSNSGTRVIFPSIAGELQSSGFDLLAPANGIGITTNDGSWLFGESAIEQSAMAGRWQDNEWILSSQYKAGVLAAITELSKASRLDVELTIALPYLDYKPFRDELISNLVGEHLVQRLGRNQQRISVVFPDRLAIIPQNIAPAFVHLLDRSGNFLQPDTSRDTIYIGILNVGSHTVELGTASITLPNSFSGVAAQSRTEQAGMYSLSRVVRPLLLGKFQGKKNRFSDHEIFDILRTGKAEVYNQDEDVGDLIASPKRQYCDRIIGLCSSNWSDEAPVPKSNLFAFVVSGGGAHIVEPYLRVNQYHPNLLVSDEPQWDVVEGMRRLRRMLSE